jgi:TPR repeat protein
MTGEADFLEQGDAKETAGDFRAARRLFERGGRLGQNHCWSRLAYMYDVGIGCRVDKAKAMSYYRRGWQQRDSVLR